MILLSSFITLGLYAIVFTFAYQLYQDRHEFFPKPDWRNRVITREESDKLHKLAEQERFFNEEFPIIDTTSLWKEMDDWEQKLS